MRVGAFADFCMGSHAVLVTGGAQNIGARIASILAGAGAQVMFADLIAEEAAETAADARGMGCDVTDKTQIEALVAATADAFGGILASVKNVGWGGRQPDPAAIPDEAFLNANRLYTNSACRMSMARLPYLEKADNGSIADSGSFSSAVPADDVLTDATAKAALNQMLVSLAHLLNTRMRVNSVLIRPVIT